MQCKECNNTQVEKRKGIFTHGEDEGDKFLRIYCPKCKSSYYRNLTKEGDGELQEINKKLDKLTEICYNLCKFLQKINCCQTADSPNPKPKPNVLNPNLKNKSNSSNEGVKGEDERRNLVDNFLRS